jgi:ATP-dependent DNA ligase
MREAVRAGRTLSAPLGFNPAQMTESPAEETAPLAPMEAKLVTELPAGEGWQFEPKWDGFRAIVRRAGAAVEIFSKSGKPLGRYFPEVLAMLADLAPRQFLLDGELILPVGGQLSFDSLQARLHPAASRIAKLARETPAQLMLFDLLALGTKDYVQRPLADRRSALEQLHEGAGGPALLLSPSTLDRKVALGWLQRSGAALDGVIAKRRHEPYRPGERAMLKVKQRRSADCVVGGVRYEAHGQAVASLLLGLYDEEGLLDHVGFVSGLSRAEKEALVATVAPLMGGVGFTGKAPGGPSRWNAGRETPWVPLAPTLVAEILYDQVTGDRFRHGTRFLRWRPDKDPRQCTFEQLAPPVAPAQLIQALDRLPRAD